MVDQHGNLLCGAKKRQGQGRCTKRAGFGTTHVGSGKCKWHGGASPDGEIAAAKEEMVVMGRPVENLHPADALIYCCRITAGEVEFCNQQIEALRLEEAVGHPEARDVEEYEIHGQVVGEQVKRKYGAPALHIWIRVRQSAVDRLAKYCKMALDANVDERRVQMAERYGEQLGAVFKAVFEQINLTAEQKREAKVALETQLLQLEVQQSVTRV